MPAIPHAPAPVTLEATLQRSQSRGRRVEIETGCGLVTVSPVPRSGTQVRTARFMASGILALVEHPAADANIAKGRDRAPSPPLVGMTKRRGATAVSRARLRRAGTELRTDHGRRRP